jgi:hypothetical protein
VRAFATAVVLLSLATVATFAFCVVDEAGEAFCEAGCSAPTLRKGRVGVGTGGTRPLQTLLPPVALRSLEHPRLQALQSASAHFMPSVVPHPTLARVLRV